MYVLGKFSTNLLLPVRDCFSLFSKQPPSLICRLCALGHDGSRAADAIPRGAGCLEIILSRAHGPQVAYISLGQGGSISKGAEDVGARVFWVLEPPTSPLDVRTDLAGRGICK